MLNTVQRQKTDKADLFMQYWQIIARDKPSPEEEYNFDKHLNRKHRFDFAFPAYRIAVEIEGNAWNVKGGGKHMQERDLEKYNIAAREGWLVFRFSPSMIKRDPYGCVSMILERMGREL